MYNGQVEANAQTVGSRSLLLVFFGFVCHWMEFLQYKSIQ